MSASKDFGKTNQPRMGARYRLLTDNGQEEAKVVGKGWGTGGRTNCVMAVLEYEDGFRETVNWPEAAMAFVDHPSFAALGGTDEPEE